MLHEQLRSIAEPVLNEVQDHPFWSGLRDGTLPEHALVRFIEQDAAHLLPAYARALARCAALAPDDADTFLLGHSVAGTLNARNRLLERYHRLAVELDLPQPQRDPVIAPATHAQASFYAAASATSFHAGLGALVPMVWFNGAVADRLRAEAKPNSRYVRWIEAYHPGDDYTEAIEAFTEMVDRAGENGTEDQRCQIVEQFTISIRYELGFADSCLGQE